MQIRVITFLSRTAIETCPIRALVAPQQRVTSRAIMVGTRLEQRMVAQELSRVTALASHMVRAPLTAVSTAQSLLATTTNRTLAPAQRQTRAASCAARGTSVIRASRRAGWVVPFLLRLAKVSCVQT